MGYWVVMAIVAIAVVAVLIAVGSEPETPEQTKRAEGGRPVWLAMGSNGTIPGVSGGSTPRQWVDLVRESLGEGVIAYDFTRSGCTVEEAQREELAAAVAVTPDVVSMLLGPDDFRDAENLGSFERRLWHILTTLHDAGSIPVLASLPDLRNLPSLAQEEDQTALTEEFQTWNVALARLVAAAGGELIECSAGSTAGLFTEDGGRYILTAAGQRWFATLMEHPVKRLLGVAGEVAPSPPASPASEA
jgi:hypothetical protein